MQPYTLYSHSQKPQASSAIDYNSDIHPDSTVPRRSSPVRQSISDATGVERLKRQLVLQNQTIQQLNYSIAYLQAEKTQFREMEVYKQQAKQKQFENSLLTRKVAELQEAVDHLKAELARNQSASDENRLLKVEHENVLKQLKEQVNENSTLRKSLQDLKADITRFSSKVAEQGEQAARIAYCEKRIKDLMDANQLLASRAKESERGCSTAYDHMVALEAENQQLREQVLQLNGVLYQSKVDSSLMFLESQGPDAADEEDALMRSRLVTLQKRVLEQENELSEKASQILALQQQTAHLESSYKKLLGEQTVQQVAASECVETSLAHSRSSLREMGQIVDQQKRQLELYHSIVSRHPDKLSLIEQAIRESSRELEEVSAK